MRRAFTLIELLVVIAIIAILSAILFPVFVAAKGAAYQMLAVGYLREVGQGSLMYAGDADDTFMPAMGADAEGYWTWFGHYTAAGLDESRGLLKPYLGKKKLVDPIAKSKPYLGDGSGFGYNWGYIGSDIHVTGRYDEYPACLAPARTTELAHPSDTLVFATSGYYYAPWEGGDGQDYDFGFVDPIGMKPNNPNVSFRHMAKRKVERDRVDASVGNAAVVMADGRARAAKVKTLKDAWFQRGDPPAAEE